MDLEVAGSSPVTHPFAAFSRGNWLVFQGQAALPKAVSGGSGMSAGADPTPLTNSPKSPSVRYLCPGESAEITEAVHLSRLSTFFHKCQLCDHRSEIARLAPSIQAQWTQLSASSEPVRIFQMNGIRGRYLNRITRNEAAQIAAVFSSTQIGRASCRERV